MRKWKALLNNKDYLNCKGEREIRRFEVYKICAWSSTGGCLQNTNEVYNGDTIKDEVMYIGRVQINLNQGKKRKLHWPRLQGGYLGLKILL